MGFTEQSLGARGQSCRAGERLGTSGKKQVRCSSLLLFLLSLKPGFHMVVKRVVNVL